MNIKPRWSGPKWRSAPFCDSWEIDGKCKGVDGMECLATRMRLVSLPSKACLCQPAVEIMGERIAEQARKAR